MRKVLSILLVIGNIYTFHYSASQQTRDTFALCGTSYSEGNTRADNDSPDVEIRKFSSDEARVKGMLKEIKTPSSEFSFLVAAENHSRNPSPFYFLSNETVQINDLFLDSIFKPPTA